MRLLSKLLQRLLGFKPGGPRGAVCPHCGGTELVVIWTDEVTHDVLRACTSCREMRWSSEIKQAK